MRLLLLASLAGCALPPTWPQGTEPLVPPPIYRTWWAQTETCAGRRGDFASVQWLVVEGASFVFEGRAHVGLRYRRGDETWILLASDYVEHEMVVRHEILHALLNQPGHPPEYFESRCQLTWSTWP